MSSVLYWNIENFGINKIQQAGKKRRANGSLIRNATEQSIQRWDYINRHIVELDPDIFIVVEIETPWNNNRGTLCRGDGETGIRAMFNNLFTQNMNWAMVPALVTGNKESVAVYFREDRVQFTGPKLWPGGNGPSNDAVTADTANPYPNDWSTMSSVDVNHNSFFNPDAPQEYCSAAVSFNDNLGNTIDFGVGIRTPYQTTFWDIVNDRNINIFTVHAPANYQGATDFIANMVRAPAVTGALADKEVRLVLGDFNLNLLYVPGSTHGAANTYTNCYAPFTNLGYAVALQPQIGPDIPPDPSLGYRSYFATHVLPADQAICWSTNAVQSDYPGYAYVTETYDSIDNALYWANPVINPQLTVINGIVGSPYNNPNSNTGGAAPEGTQVFACELDWSWNGQNAQNPMAPSKAPLYTAWTGIYRSFTSWNQFGKIRSTSDHLPLFFTF